MIYCPGSFIFTREGNPGKGYVHHWFETVLMLPSLDSRGYFNIHDRKYGPIEAHLSKTACEKVCNVVRILPQMFHFEMLPRLDTWPKSFKLLPPADDSIALYFFPGDMRCLV